MAIGIEFKHGLNSQKQMKNQDLNRKNIMNNLKSLSFGIVCPISANLFARSVRFYARDFHELFGR